MVSLKDLKDGIKEGVDISGRLNRLEQDMDEVKANTGPEGAIVLALKEIDKHIVELKNAIQNGARK